VTTSRKSQTLARTATSRPPHLLAMLHVIDDNVAPEHCGGRRKFGETEDIAFPKEIVANEAHVCQRGKVTEKLEEVARALNEGNALPWNSSAMPDERLADSSHAMSGHDVGVSRFLPSIPYCSSYRIWKDLLLRLDSDSAAAEACWYMPLAATYFLRFVSTFMVSHPRGYESSCRNYFSYPRGWDMTSNTAYSYPYSTHERYPLTSNPLLLSVCRKPLCLEPDSNRPRICARQIRVHSVSKTPIVGLPHSPNSAIRRLDAFQPHEHTSTRSAQR
jgi:hypothetical protein